MAGAIVASVSVIVGPASAAIIGGDPPWAGIELFYEEEAGWLEAVGAVNEIRFDEFGATQITDQYEHFGLSVDADQFFFAKESGSFEDGWGAENVDAGGALLLEFTEPLNAIAFRTPGFPIYTFYFEGEQVGWFPPPSGFNGFVTDFEFDSIVLSGMLVSAIDDMYIPVVPAPGAAVLMFAAAWRSSRRRR